MTTTALAQSSRANSDKLLQAEQSILSSLSARAVSFMPHQPVVSAPAKKAPKRATSLNAEGGPAAPPKQEPSQEEPSRASDETLAQPVVVKSVQLEDSSQLRTANALLRSQLEQREIQVKELSKQVQELQSLPVPGEP